MDFYSHVNDRTQRAEKHRKDKKSFNTYIRPELHIDSLCFTQSSWTVTAMTFINVMMGWSELGSVY